MKRTAGQDAEKALLLEVRGRTGVAITPEGRFVGVRCLPHHEEGQEIALPAARREGRVGWGLRPGLVTAAACAAILLVLLPLAVGRVLASGLPMAYVTLDINPSLEFGVNRWERVVACRALNPEGEQVLSGLKWRGRPVDDVVSDAGVQAASLGFLDSGPAEVIVAAVPALDKGLLSPGLEKRLERLRQGLGERMAAASGGQGPSSLTVETVLGDSVSLRQQAETLGLSVGKYIVLLEAQEDGLDIDAEDLEQGGVGQALIAAGGHPGEVLRKAHENREMSRLAHTFSERNGFGPDDSKDEEDTGNGPTGQPGGTGQGGTGQGGTGQGGTGQGGTGQGQGGGQGGTGQGQGGGQGGTGQGQGGGQGGSGRGHGGRPENGDSSDQSGSGGSDQDGTQGEHAADEDGSDDGGAGLDDQGASDGSKDSGNGGEGGEGSDHDSGGGH